MLHNDVRIFADIHVVNLLSGRLTFVSFLLYTLSRSVRYMDIFCKIMNGEIPSNTIWEDDIVKVILDVSPRSNGHCLIIPKKHYQDLYDIETNVLNHIMEVAKEISKLLTEKLGCDGITLEQNNGIIQEVKHFHLHVIPKYEINKTLLDVKEVYDQIKE